MPNPNDFDNEEKWMGACVPQMMGEGKPNEQAVAACSAMWVNKMDALKYRMTLVSVKAVGDWELDVNAVPFDIRDSDNQWFDSSTDVMPEIFQTPLIAYQHGVTQGAQAIQDKPIVLGKAVPGSLTKETDGWHVRVILDKAVQQARDIWEAAKKGFVAVSSGSIAHLARLDVGGKMKMYDKGTPGRIAVWALAEISLWENGNGNLSPANKYAYALPAMKAIYREAEMSFPEIKEPHGASQNADKAAMRAKVLKQSQKILERFKA